MWVSRWHCLVAVSYTHLDVYKRQPLYWLFPSQPQHASNRLPSTTQQEKDGNHPSTYQDNWLRSSTICRGDTECSLPLQQTSSSISPFSSYLPHFCPIEQNQLGQILDLGTLALAMSLFRAVINFTVLPDVCLICSQKFSLLSDIIPRYFAACLDYTTTSPTWIGRNPSLCQDHNRCLAQCQ